MTPRTILAAVTVIFIAVFAYGYITLSKKPAAPASVANNMATTTPSDGSANSPQANTGLTDSTNPTNNTQPASYTMSQVATHKTTSSCWVAISGSVYDVTGWINNHPGGPGPILSLCGTDGTALFTGQHSGQARPSNELTKFKIGTLVQ